MEKLSPNRAQLFVRNKYTVFTMGGTVAKGNEVIHQLTRNENVTLYIAITLVNRITLYQVYRRFSVADESDKFRLSLQEPKPNGTLGLTVYVCLCI